MAGKLTHDIDTAAHRWPCASGGVTRRRGVHRPPDQLCSRADAVQSCSHWHKASGEPLSACEVAGSTPVTAPLGQAQVVAARTIALTGPPPINFDFRNNEIGGSASNALFCLLCHVFAKMVHEHPIQWPNQRDLGTELRCHIRLLLFLYRQCVFVFLESIQHFANIFTTATTVISIRVRSGVIQKSGPRCCARFIAKVKARYVLFTALLPIKRCKWLGIHKTVHRSDCVWVVFDRRDLKDPAWRRVQHGDQLIHPSLVMHVPNQA